MEYRGRRRFERALPSGRPEDYFDNGEERVESFISIVEKYLYDLKRMQTFINNAAKSKASGFLEDSIATAEKVLSAPHWQGIVAGAKVEEEDIREAWKYERGAGRFDDDYLDDFHDKYIPIIQDLARQVKKVAPRFENRLKKLKRDAELKRAMYERNNKSRYPFSRRSRWWA